MSRPIARSLSSLASTSAPSTTPLIPRAFQSHITHHLRTTPAPSSDPTIRIPNPFLPSFSQTSQTWTPPHISLRRQALLLRQFPSTSLPASPRSVFGTPAQTSLVSGEGLPTIEWVGEPKEKVVKGKKGNGLRAFSNGKKFKGHKYEREGRKRRAETVVRMEGMEARVEEWRKTKTAAKKAIRPSLPF